MIRIVLADDQPLVRVGVRALVESVPDMEVVGEAGTGTETVRVVQDTLPDVAVLDIRMPGMSGIEASRKILADPNCCATRILVLTTFEIDEYVYEALRAGVSGFLLKDADPEEILRGIRTVAEGNALLSPSVTQQVIRTFAQQSALPAGKSALIRELTSREREVLALIGKGMSNDEIAEALSMSPATARTHVSRILSKTSCRDRAQLVVIAYESGLMR